MVLSPPAELDPMGVHASSEQRFNGGGPQASAQLSCRPDAHCRSRPGAQRSRCGLTHARATTAMSAARLRRNGGACCGSDRCGAGGSRLRTPPLSGRASSTSPLPECTRRPSRPTCAGCAAGCDSRACHAPRPAAQPAHVRPRISSKSIGRTRRGDDLSWSRANRLDLLQLNVMRSECPADAPQVATGVVV